VSTAVDITQEPSGCLARKPRRTKRPVTADPKFQALQAVGVPWPGVTGRPEVFRKAQVIITMGDSDQTRWIGMISKSDLELRDYVMEGNTLRDSCGSQ